MSRVVVDLRNDSRSNARGAIVSRSALHARFAEPTQSPAALDERNTSCFVRSVRPSSADSSTDFRGTRNAAKKKKAFPVVGPG